MSVVIGNPTLHAKTGAGMKWNTIYPCDFTYVRFMFLRDNCRPIHLFCGSGPKFHIGESDMKINFRYKAGADVADPFSQFENEVIKGVMSLMSKAQLRVELGAESHIPDLYHIHIVNSQNLKGFIPADDALVYKKWFE